MIVGLWFRHCVALLGNARGATLNVLTAANADAVVPELWNDRMRYLADRTGLLSRLAGVDGSNAAVLEQTDLTKQPGDLVRFPLLGRLLRAPVSGTTALEGSEEKAPVGSFSVTPVYYRMASAINKVALKVSQLKPSHINKLLADWLARTLDDDGFNQMLNTETVTNITRYAGNATSRATLGDGDVLTGKEMKYLHLLGLRRGLLPFKVTKFGVLPWATFATILSDIDYTMLTGADDYEQDVRLAQSRGENNPAISGRCDFYKGQVLYPVTSPNPGDGFMGSFLRPEARLRTTINSSDTSISVGPSTQITGVDYGKYCGTTGTIRIDSEQMTLSANSSNTMTVSARGVNGTTAAAHTAGALITLNNNGRVLTLGANALMRAWTMKPSMDPSQVVNITQQRDYGFEKGFGVDYMYANGAVVGSGDSQPANYAILEVTSANPLRVG